MNMVAIDLRNHIKTIMMKSTMLGRKQKPPGEVFSDPC